MPNDQSQRTAPARPAPARRGRKPGTGTRRDEIVRIAQDLFARNGFDGTSIRDIADAAGLTKPALYYHFTDKEALYEQVLVDRMSRLIVSVEAAMAEVEGPLERVRAYLRTHSSRMDKDRDAWLMSRQSFLSISDEDRRQKVTELRDRFEHILRDEIRAAMDQGVLDDDISPAMVAKMLLSSLNDVPRWLRPDGRLKAEDVAMTYADIALRGLIRAA
ncbi:TetR/AcrR family transcriptional regulator [Oceanicola sp. 22II-s10i]|uniref:TetR/AcrR family transcriptional regulator n=1 Tax=Oceanicola sp. 22II-s10i TaxID=1317116 RepID=UPI000B51F33F|nr:TetR/AcrR family transcriptional regulator [Oceanicola sp. 22II-s10i]